MDQVFMLNRKAPQNTTAVICLELTLTFLRAMSVRQTQKHKNINV